jgi:hypothetical protein
MSPITLVRHVRGKPRPALLDPAVHWGAAVREGVDSGPPIPFSRVQVPTHIEQPPLPSEPLARRAEELNLPPEQNRAQLPGVVAFGRFSLRCSYVIHP